jgi:hypothetical protein
LPANIGGGGGGEAGGCDSDNRQDKQARASRIDEATTGDASEDEHRHCPSAVVGMTASPLRHVCAAGHIAVMEMLCVRAAAPPVRVFRVIKWKNSRPPSDSTKAACGGA